MCKLLIVLGAKKPAAVRQLMGAILEPMSRQNSDGVGYTAIRKNGDIFTERWLDNKEGLQGPPSETEKGKLKKAFGPMVDIEPVSDNGYAVQGTLNWSDVTSVMMHTRLATCGKTFANVHPFVDDDNETAIVHNGVIRNHEDFEKLNSTCDSETILTQYKALKMGEDAQNIENLVGELEGYWAIAATGKGADDKRYLDIFTSNKQPSSGSLAVCYIKEIGGHVFISTRTHLSEAINKLGWDKNYTSYDVVPHVFSRFNSVTGERLESIDYREDMGSYTVQKNTYSHTRTHSISKKKQEENRRLLSQNSTGSNNKQGSTGKGGTGSGNGSNSSGSGGSGGTKVHGSVVRVGSGAVSSFYNKGHNETVGNDSTSSESNNSTHFSTEELEALEYYESKNKKPGDYSPLFNSSTGTSKNFESDLSNFLEGYEASDSKYGGNVLDTQLTDKELDELDDFLEKLNTTDAEILNGLPNDMKYGFLKSIKNKGA